jgi:hypothetical protein
MLVLPLWCDLEFSIRRCANAMTAMDCVDNYCFRFGTINKTSHVDRWDDFFVAFSSLVLLGASSA